LTRLDSAQPIPVAAAPRGAFVIGNTGKLGDELLNVLLESPAYGRVAVGVRKSMRSHVAKLEPLPVPKDRAGWNPAAQLQWVPEDLYLCIEPAASSFWKIDKPYVPVTSAWAAELALALRAAGARRVVVITPLEAILQIGTAPAIQSEDEMRIVAAGFERVLLLRPSEEGRAEAASGFFPAVGGLVTRTLGSYLTPRSVQPVRVRRAAELAVATLATMAGGVQVVGAARLRELVGDPMEAKRRY
jgi:hypothetical protein